MMRMSKIRRSQVPGKFYQLLSRQSLTQFSQGGLAGWIVWPKPEPLAPLELTVEVPGRMRQIRFVLFGPSTIFDFDRPEHQGTRDQAFRRASSSPAPSIPPEIQAGCDYDLAHEFLCQCSA